MSPVSLSDSELAAIMNAARPLEPRDRDQFLRDVAGELAALPMLGDGALHRVLMALQRKYFDPPDLRVAVGKYDWRPPHGFGRGALCPAFWGTF